MPVQSAKWRNCQCTPRSATCLRADVAWREDLSFPHASVLGVAVDQAEKADRRTTCLKLNLALLMAVSGSCEHCVK